MRLYRVQIRRFRGIRELDWTVGGRCVCLVGPGDSSKSTILDAIELALAPRYRLYLDDSDFFNLNVDEPIQIEVTVGPVPEPLMTEARFGMCMRGWSAEDGLHDEPEGLIPVLTIQLLIEASLEPSWTVILDRDPGGKPISAADRAHFGAVRLGEAPDWQLSWRRGSILSRLTSDTDSLPALLAEASRAARISIEEIEGRLLPLSEAAKRAQELGAQFGVSVQDGYCPNLDVQAVTIREGGLSLHDGRVPLRRAGLGSRRLLALALQRDASRDGGVTLIDEIEHGLEPYRVRQLVANLGGNDHFEADIDDAGTEQIVMATHSSVVVEHLDARNIGVVRNGDGIVTVTAIPGDLQHLVRRSSEALLARKILVCEGKTEAGVLTALDRFLVDKGLPPFATGGVALVPGGGSEAARAALQLSQLGYQVAYFGDSDQAMKPSAAELAGAGVRVLLWADECAIEDRVFRDLPWEAVARLLGLVEASAQSIRGSILNHDETLDLPEDPDEWKDSPPLRGALAAASKKSEWFKRVSLGVGMGVIICEYWDSIQETNLAEVLSLVRDWAHSDV